MTCDARIRTMRPINETEITCEADEPHNTHTGTIRDYAYPGSETKVNWMEDDRRTFHGEWPGDCSHVMCILPKHHRGDHVQ